MGWFRKARPQGAPPPGMTYRNPFDAVPQVAPGVTVVRGPEAPPDGLLLRRNLEPQTRFGAAVARYLRYERKVHLTLDRSGTLFWGLIDGSRNLEQIAGRVRTDLGMADEDARRATLLYVKQLMLRSFVQLRVPAPHATGGGRQGRAMRSAA